MMNEDKTTDSECNVCEEKPTNTERLLNAGFSRPERKYLLGHNPIVPLHLELERLAQERLHKEGIYPTKNNTILRRIK